MPNFNKNGPAGQGPMSGKGMGVCSTAAEFGGMGRGRGMGSRCRNADSSRFQGGGMEMGQRSGGMRGPGAMQQPPVERDDREALRAAYEAAQQDLASLKRRLDELEGGSSSE